MRRMTASLILICFSAATTVRVQGERARHSERVTGVLHFVDDQQITVAVPRQSRTDLIKFDRASVERVERVLGSNDARKKNILKGLGVGTVFALIGTLAKLTIGGGAGVGALMSIGEERVRYLAIYERSATPLSRVS